MSDEILDVPSQALATVPPSLLPVFRGQQMTEAFTAYRELQRALDAGMPDQLMNIRGKMFRKKGYWRAIATAFNLNVSCVREEATPEGWRVVYRAATASGRFVDGDGACAHAEKSDSMDTDHNVRAHAHTRGFNRAVSNLVGFGEVSAEEVRRVVSQPERPAPPRATWPPDAATRENRGTLISDKQQKRFFAIGKSKGWTTEQMRALLEGYGFMSSKSITTASYEAICSSLEKGPAPAETDEMPAVEEVF